MLVACRLAGLSALEGHYADDNAQAQSGVEELQERRGPRPSEVYAQARRELQRGGPAPWPLGAAGFGLVRAVSAAQKSRSGRRRWGTPRCCRSPEDCADAVRRGYLPLPPA